MAVEEKKTLLTYSGLKQYQEELEFLKSVKRKEIADKLKVAREQGDLSENAEYDAAKDEQSDNEKRIDELEQLLKNVEVITDDDVDSEKVSVGTKVKVRDLEYKEDMVFDIVIPKYLKIFNNKTIKHIILTSKRSKAKQIANMTKCKRCASQHTIPSSYNPAPVGPST